MSLRFARLGELCDVRSGGTPSRSVNAYFDGHIPWAKISDIEACDGVLMKTEESISRLGLDAIRGRIFPENTLLFAIYGSIGKMAVAGVPLSANQAILGIQNSSQDVLDSRFLLRFLESRRGQFLADGAGIAQKNLSAAYVRNIEIPLPPLEEQKRIAAILDQADALRRFRARALDRLNALGQAIFHEMFGDPIVNPMDWPKRKVGDLCSRVSVGVVIQPASYYVAEGVPAIRGTNIKLDGIDLDDLVYFSEEASNGPLRKSRLKAGDLIAVRSGRPGLSAVVPEHLDGANCIDVLIATTRTEVLSSLFLRDFLNSAGGRKVILSESRGQVQQHFNVKSLSEAEVILPPVEVQLEYAGRMEAVSKMKASFYKAADREAALFGSLQQRAFQGHL